MKYIKNFNENFLSLNEGFDFLKFSKASDDDAIKMLRNEYGESIDGEDFYPGLDDIKKNSNGMYQLANDKLEVLISKGLVKLSDDEDEADDFIYYIIESKLKNIQKPKGLKIGNIISHITDKDMKVEIIDYLYIDDNTEQTEVSDF